MTIKKIRMDYHRNGVFGVGFYVILFRWKDREANLAKTRRMLATVFPAPGTVAVLDLDETAQEHLTFEEGNRWRGDDFEPALRALIAEYEEA